MKKNKCKDCYVEVEKVRVARLFGFALLWLLVVAYGVSTSYLTNQINLDSASGLLITATVFVRFVGIVICAAAIIGLLGFIAMTCSDGLDDFFKATKEVSVKQFNSNIRGR